MSTLYGYGSAPHGQHAKGASPETQRAFLQKYTSQELVHISKVSRFLQSLAGRAILAEHRVVGSLEVCQSQKDFHIVSVASAELLIPSTDDFNGLYLFAGPHIILRCHEEQSSGPLPFSYIFEDEAYEKFLLPCVKDMLSERNVDIPLAFVGSILDSVCGANDTC